MVGDDDRVGYNDFLRFVRSRKPRRLQMQGAEAAEWRVRQAAGSDRLVVDATGGFDGFGRGGAALVTRMEDPIAGGATALALGGGATGLDGEALLTPWTVEDWLVKSASGKERKRFSRLFRSMQDF